MGFINQEKIMILYRKFSVSFNRQNKTKIQNIAEYTIVIYTIWKIIWQENGFSEKMYISKEISVNLASAINYRDGGH